MGGKELERYTGRSRSKTLEGRCASGPAQHDGDPKQRIAERPQGVRLAVWVIERRAGRKFPRLAARHGYGAPKCRASSRPGAAVSVLYRVGDDIHIG